MNLTKEAVYENLLPLLDRILLLSDVTSVKIKDCFLSAADWPAKELAAKAVDASYHDILSDLDIHIQFSSPSVPPARQLAELLGFLRDACLGISFSDENNVSLLRIITKQGMRYDIIAHPATTGSGLTADTHTTTGNDISPDSDTAAAPDSLPPSWELEKADSFWFIAIQALAKLYRGDYLIADHLTNMLINETLVAQMIERDYKYGTNIHRFGYREALAYQADPAEPRPFLDSSDSARRDARFYHIADKLYRGAAAYDRLITRLNPCYEERRMLYYEIWHAYEIGMPMKLACL